MAKRFAPVTSMKPTASLEDSLKHEMYNKFFKANKKGRIATFWQPVWHPTIFD